MESNEIITTAKNFLKERTNSLENDCKHCLFKDHSAPFPALLYCFSNIDLLGALYVGNAKDDAPTTKQSMDYMTGIMKYPELQAKLLQKVFRHKLVHLAQPNPVTNFENKKYLWWECHEPNRALHLKIENTDKQNEYIFRISINDFLEDIVDSVWSANGYFEQLSKNMGSLQSNFQTAHKQIW